MRAGEGNRTLVLSLVSPDEDSLHQRYCSCLQVTPKIEGPLGTPTDREFR
jgi:hypothetical protein